MKRMQMPHRIRGWGLTTVIALLTTAILLNGCAGTALQKWAMFNASDDAKKSFESYILNPAYKYFYSGPDAHPIALLGVRKDLILEPADFWKPIKSPMDLKQVVIGMESRLRGLNQYAWGFDIINRQNNKIGIWYSIPKATTTVLEKDNGVVVIYTPDIETYMKMDKDGANR